MTEWHNRYAQFELRADSDDDGLTLDGYAAVFNAETVIEDRSGPFIEKIAPGAFKRSLGQRAPVLQFDHGTHPVVGSMPLGVIRSIREDAHGLRVKAVLSDNWMTKPVRDAIASGAINGMSFRFRPIQDSWDESGDMPVRTIHEVELAEVGPVVFPAYPQTRVSVRCDNALMDATSEQIRSRMLTDFPESPAREGTDEGEAPTETPVTPSLGDSPSRHSRHIDTSAVLERISARMARIAP